MRYVLFAGQEGSTLVADVGIDFSSVDCEWYAIERDEQPVCVFAAATDAEAAQLRNDVIGVGEFDMPEACGGFAVGWSVRRFLMLEAIDDQLTRDGFDEPRASLAVNVSIAISRLWDEMAQEDRDEVIKHAVVERVERLKKRL